MDIFVQFFLSFQINYKITVFLGLLFFIIILYFFIKSIQLRYFKADGFLSTVPSQKKNDKKQRKLKFCNFFYQSISHLEYLCLDLVDISDLIKEKIGFLYRLDRDQFAYLKNIFNNDLVYAFNFVDDAIHEKARENMEVLRANKIKISVRRCDYLNGSAFPKMNKRFSKAVEHLHSFCERFIGHLDEIIENNEQEE